MTVETSPADLITIFVRDDPADDVSAFVWIGVDGAGIAPVSAAPAKRPHPNGLDSLPRRSRPHTGATGHSPMFRRPVRNRT